MTPARFWKLMRRRKKALAVHRALLEDWHKRHHLVAGLVEAGIGNIAETDAHVLEKRAYLTLMRALYEQLMTGKSGLKDEDLVALSKALAEHRRVSAREPLPKGTGREQEPPDREESWEQFAAAVRDVYGLDSQPPSTQHANQPGSAEFATAGPACCRVLRSS